MTSLIRRLALAMATASLVLGSLALPAAARGPQVAMPSVARIQAAGGRLVAVTRRGGRTHFEAVKAPRGRELATARALASRPDVIAVTVDRTATIDAWPDAGSPNDPYFAGSQGDLTQINVGGAWPITRGAGATVAVLDTGANLSHPDLAGLRVVGTYNALDGTSNIADGHGHGTHVLGTVAAQTNNGIGVAGIAPDTNILVVKVLGDNGSGSWSAIGNGIEWAIAHGATVITMSLGSSGTAEQFAGFAYAPDDAYRAGITVIAAAGNTGTTGLHFPACFEHVLSIASVGASGTRSSFSTMNACNDLAAPGEGTLSTSNAGGYVGMSGTSMATPHVAGVIALIQSAVPGIRPDAVANALEATALDKGDAGRDDLYGFGIVNAGSALDVAAGGTPPPPVPTPTPAPTPVPLPARVASLTASPTSIKYDPNGYCPTAVRGTTITATTSAASATNAAATSVTLSYLKPGTTTPVSVSMTRGNSSSAGTTWTAILSSQAAGLSTAGSVSYWVQAANAAGSTVRFPAGTAVSRITVAVCPNVAPAISALWTDRTVVATNPLGSGTVPGGMATTFTVSAIATDTDGIASASVALTGAGLASAAVVPMTQSGGTWFATVNPTALRIAGGTLAVKLTVTDGRGLSFVKAGPAITVVRADTAGSVAITGVANAADNRPVVTITADDPDAVFGATTSTLAVSVRWSATYTTAMGVPGVAPVITTPAVFKGGRTWQAKLPTTWLTTAITSATITATPLAKDPYLVVTTGQAVTADVAAVGAPTVMASWASATAVYTDPLATGNVAALGPMPGSVTFSARIADTDDITGASIVYSAPGFTGTRSLPMTKADGVWLATLTPSSAGITGTGRITWKVAATDALGLVGFGTSGAVTVTRADTAGQAAVQGAAPDSTNATWITVTADDPDAAFPTATTTNLVVKVRWSAAYTLATGPRTSGGTGTAVYAGGKTWRLKVASGTWLTAARSATFTLTPMATDPYGKVTTGATTQQAIRAYGS